jgi:hypothetical protein
VLNQTMNQLQQEVEALQKLGKDIRSSLPQAAASHCGAQVDELNVRLDRFQFVNATGLMPTKSTPETQQKTERVEPVETS